MDIEARMLQVEREIVSRRPDGRRQIDYRRFHDVLPLADADA